MGDLDWRLRLEWYRQLGNVHPLLGALGEKPGWEATAACKVGERQCWRDALRLKSARCKAQRFEFDSATTANAWLCTLHVEGEELSVLRGAAKTIMHSRPLLSNG